MGVMRTADASAARARTAASDIRIEAPPSLKATPPMAGMTIFKAWSAAVSLDTNFAIPWPLSGSSLSPGTAEICDVSTRSGGPGPVG